ncbi:hypothetical protein PP175_25910 (plasmid) [Aneurinibacillus sp. Ricciae_BoGa-3]|uniref:hypothetical protein n=1 Tax=Aneurinibacillus sp. Ricciae_BoGa-3 TaxID=3022697 RepID=UPI0023420B24|nr:hypothetical protein [Aneurinibacillus sp. Ricciae_BoGa-3]WCK57505.1 hypothetical protein PP175_25910 [Aneurinibacillus sp. Ricciae_BoGa-3]
MSTVITDGYIFKRKLSLDELQAFSMELRTKMQEVAVEICERLVAERITDMIDTVTLQGEQAVKDKYGEKQVDMDCAVVSEAYCDLHREHRKFKAGETFDLDANFDCRMVVYPMKRKLLAVFLCQHQEYRKAWEALELISDYHYQNQTNRPETITKRQWEKRKQDWDVALPGLGHLSLNGMVIDIVNHIPVIQQLHKEKIVEHIPPLKKRVIEQANQILMEKKWKELKIEKNEEGFEKFMAVQSWLRSPEGKEKLLGEQKRLLSLINPLISTEDVMKPLKQHVASDTNDNSQKTKTTV